MVHVSGSEEEVPMDPLRGPMVLQLDGTTTHLQTVRGICGGGQASRRREDARVKCWKDEVTGETMLNIQNDQTHSKTMEDQFFSRKIIGNQLFLWEMFKS